MTTNFDLNELARAAQDILDKHEKGQEFILSNVHEISRKAYERFPEDPVIKQFAFVIERLAEKHGNSALISQAEMTNIYNNLTGIAGENRFRSVLGGFIFDSPVKTAQKSEFIEANRSGTADPFDYSDHLDKTLINSLNHAFGGSINEYKAYNEKAAARGAELVEAELKAMGFVSPKVEIVDGNKDALLYNAHFDTKSGQVAVGIPLDLSNGKVLFPSTFIAGDHLEELHADKLMYFIDKRANENLSGAVAGGEARAELDLTPEAEMPQELAHLPHDFENDMLEAVCSFGKDAVSSGKYVVASELAVAGFRNAQVKFGAETSDGVVYLAALHTPRGVVEIEVPVEMISVAEDRYKPLAPSYFAYDGVIEDFTAPKLQRFAVSMPAKSSGQIVCSTEHSYMLLPELRDEIIKSASENDYVSCEMILGTISDRFSEEDYKNAVADYHYLLMLKTGQKEQQKCSREIPAGKTSILPVCGHYNVPINKVVVGEDGVCRLKTSIERERLNPIEETGAAISTSKIFWS